MSDPKFHVGDFVAVCTNPLKLIMPTAVVSDFRFDEGGNYYNHGTGNISYCKPEWAYLVIGFDKWISEDFLRLINPDTEYLESETAKEQTA